MNDDPFALFITWTCYGTWLPGDRRGHVSNTLRADGGFEAKQNIPGTPYTAGDDFARSRARTLQEQPTMRLTANQAGCAAKTLAESAKGRGWIIPRAAVMSNHVHVVVMDCPDDGPAVRRIMKGTSQAELSRFCGVPKRWWTAGGSNRYLHDEESILGAMRYVENQAGVLARIVNDVVTTRSRNNAPQQ